MNSSEKLSGLMKRDEDENVAQTESHSNVITAQRPLSHLDTKVETPQICNNDDETENKFRWRHFFDLSYLPQWLKYLNPLDIVDSLESVSTSTSSLPGRIGCAQVHTPNPSGHQEIDHRSLEIGCSKHDHGLSNYNCEEVITDHNACCEGCKQKGRSICGYNSPNNKHYSDRYTRPTNIGAASVSSNEEARRNTSNHACECFVHEEKQEPSEQETSAIKICSGHDNLCQCCKRKQSSTNSELMPEREQVFLQELTFHHKSSCPRCSIKTPSNYSSACKEAMLEQARAILKQLTLVHKTGCHSCKQNQNVTNLKETSSYLETMLEQAWSYPQKVSPVQTSCIQACKPICCKYYSATESDKSGCKRCQKMDMPVSSKHSSSKEPAKSYSQRYIQKSRLICCKCSSATESDKSGCQRYQKLAKPVSCIHSPSKESAKSCCQRCIQKGRLICCKHSLATESDKSYCKRCQELGKPICCKHSCPIVSENNRNSGTIIDATCKCSQSSLQECAKKQSHSTDNGCREFKSSSRLCVQTSSLKPGQPIQRCRSAVEVKYEQRSSNVPCCKHYSQDAQPVLSGLHHESCHSSQSAVESQKETICTGECETPLQSKEQHNDFVCSLSSNKNPLESVGDRDISDHSSTQCSAHGQKDGGIMPKNGHSLTKEPDEISCSLSSNKNPLENVGDRDISDHSSTQCSALCQKDDDIRPKQGLSLTKEPDDQTLCTPPNCKHSIQIINMEPDDQELSTFPSCKHSTRTINSQIIPSLSQSVCDEVCPAPCHENSLPSPESGRPIPAPVQSNDLASSEGCPKCNSQHAATAPMCQEKCMVDAEYKAFLDEQSGMVITRQLLDKGTSCQEWQFKGLELKADPYNYRYYY